MIELTKKEQVIEENASFAEALEHLQHFFEGQDFIAIKTAVQRRDVQEKEQMQRVISQEELLQREFSDLTSLKQAKLRHQAQLSDQQRQIAKQLPCLMYLNGL